MAFSICQKLTMESTIRFTSGLGEILRMPENSERNRAIFAAHASGETVESLCAKYGLKPGSLYAVILAEKHRRAFSTLSVYKEARSHAAIAHGNRPPPSGTFS